jgi:hypothetical protein
MTSPVSPGLPAHGSTPAATAQPATRDPATFRQLSLTSSVPPCTISIDDLKRLYLELENKAREAFERYAASIQRPADMPMEEFQRLRDDAADRAHVTVLIVGAAGEQLAATTAELLEPIHLPESITSIMFDSAVNLQSINVNLPNQFRVYLDLRPPTAVVSHDPWNQPTPNDSKIEVRGPDSTWVTAVFETVNSFFKRRKRTRAWLHSPITFNVLGWIFGFPAALWFAYRLDSVLVRIIPSVQTALRAAADVYFFLLGMFLVRAIIYGFRWIFPVIELQHTKSQTARRILGAILASLLLALAYDLLKALRVLPVP